MRSSRIVVCAIAYLSVLVGIVTFSVSLAEAAQTPGPGGTYNCWDRCRYGAGCNTSCYDDGVLTTCNEYHYSCGGVGGVVGQGCGDGGCWFDGYLGFENYSNCPTDCGNGSCVPPGGWDDVQGNTDCCSGQAVPGSTVCSDPADYGTDWVSCVHRCQ